MNIYISCIYKITNHTTNKIYIGSTCNLVKRHGDHVRCLLKNIHSNKKLQRAWNKYGPKSFSLLIVERVDVEELLSKERHYTILYNSVKNGYNYNVPAQRGKVSLLTEDEINDKKLKMKEYMKHYNKEYRSKNQEKIKENKSKKYQENKEYIKIKRKDYHQNYYQTNKQHMIEYYEKNKNQILANRDHDKVLASKKAYRERNKERINQKQRENYKTKKDKLRELTLTNDILSHISPFTREL